MTRTSTTVRADANGGAVLHAPAAFSDEASARKEQGLLRARLRKRLAAETAFVLDVEFNASLGFTILFGASGAGKTTVLDCIAGLLLPDAGRITIGGRILFDSTLGVNLRVERRQVG